MNVQKDKFIPTKILKQKITKKIWSIKKRCQIFVAYKILIWIPLATAHKY